MKGLFELIKLIFGPKAISKTIGTRTNVIRLPNNKTKRYTKQDLNIEAASDAAAMNAKKEMEELIPEIPKMNDAERLIFEGNLRRLKNKLGLRSETDPTAEVFEFGTKEKVTPGGIASLTEQAGQKAPPGTVMGNLESRLNKLRASGKELEDIAKEKGGVKFSIPEEGMFNQELSADNLFDTIIKQQERFKKIQDSGLVTSTAREILQRDIKAGKLKLPKEIEDRIMLVDGNPGTVNPVEVFRTNYGEDALEQIDSLIPELANAQSYSDLVKIVEKKYPMKPLAKPRKETMSLDEAAKAEEENILTPKKPEDPEEFATGGRVGMAIGGDPFTQAEQQQRARQSYQDYLDRIGYQGRQQLGTYTAPTGVDTSAYQGFSVPADYMSNIPSAVSSTVSSTPSSTVSSTPSSTASYGTSVALPATGDYGGTVYKSASLGAGSSSGAGSSFGGGGDGGTSVGTSTGTPPALEAVQPSVSGGIMDQFQNTADSVFSGYQTPTTSVTYEPPTANTPGRFIETPYQPSSEESIEGIRNPFEVSDLEPGYEAVPVGYSAYEGILPGYTYNESLDSYMDPSGNIVSRSGYYDAIANYNATDGSYYPGSDKDKYLGASPSEIESIIEGIRNPFEVSDLEPGYEAVPVVEKPDLEPGYEAVPASEFGLYNLPGTITLTPEGPVYYDPNELEGGAIPVEVPQGPSMTDKLLEQAKGAGKNYLIATALNAVVPGLGALYTGGKMAYNMLPEPIKQKTMEQLYKLDPESAPGYREQFFGGQPLTGFNS